MSFKEELEKILLHYSSESFDADYEANDDKREQAKETAITSIINLVDKSLPEKIDYINFEDKTTDAMDATYVGGYNTAINRMRAIIRVEI
jgi:hypothetical protein